MEKIIYRLTLDAHKNGIQKTLRGFETADKVARRIVVSLTSGSDTYEIADNVVAMMYVTTPNATVPSVNACKIEGNTIIYDVLPIEEAGITYMQLKLIGTDEDGVDSVLASPKFSVEVEESMMNDNAVEQTTEFTALEDAVAKAHGVYNSRLLRVEIEADCTFKAYYADGTVYENGFLKDAVYNGNAIIAESYAKGGTGAREGEDTDNAMYYSNVSRSASLDTIVIADQAKAMLEEAKLLTGITAFMVNFETGELGYTSNDYEFDVNEETGYLEVKGDDAFNPLVYVQEQVEEYLDTKTEELDKIEIKTTKERTNKGTKHGGFRLNKVVANTVQNGTPSPRTPFPLLSTGDCVEFINGMVMDSGAEVYGSTRIITKNKIPCKKGDVVKIQTDLTSRYLIYYDSNGNYISYKGVSNNTDITIDVECSYFKVEVGSGNTSTTPITPQTVGKITITINGKYLGCAKTRLVVDLIQGYLDSSTGAYVNTTGFVCSKNFKPCVSGDTITLNLDKSNGILVHFYNDNGYISTQGDGGAVTTKTVTVPSGATRFKYTIGNGSTTVDNVGKVILKINGVGETVSYYTTQYPMIKGSTLFRENGLVKAMHTEKNVLLKNLAWVTYSATPRVYYASLNDCMLGYQTSRCSHFVNINESWDGSDISYSDHTSSKYKFFNTEFETQSEWEAWLAESNAELQYKLATPIIETLDTASQIALNGLETFDGMTIVEFDTRVQPLEFEAEVGTSKVGAYTLKSLNNSESNAVRMNELAVALVSL